MSWGQSLRGWCRGVLGLAVAMAAGCGYSTASLVRPEFHRVYLPMFRNETFYRDVEVQVTQQVQRELASRSGIFIVPQEQADIVLEGTIVDVFQRVLTENQLNQIQETSATLRIHVDLRDAQSGTVLKSYEVTDRAEFLVSQGGALEAVSVESFFDVARMIVQGLEQEFPRGPGRPP